jgi:hypothetical protein
VAEFAKKRESKAEAKARLLKAADEAEKTGAIVPFNRKRMVGPKDIPATVSVAKKEESVDDKIREAKVSGPKTLPFRKGSKSEKMVLMVIEPKDATEAEICKAIGWEGCAVTLRRAVKRAGLTLKSSKNDAGKTVYTAA